MLQKSPWVQMSYFFPVYSNHLYIKATLRFEHLKTPILLSSYCHLSHFFPALSILLALQNRTKKSRSVLNTNKEHIFSTRLHPVNCEPEGKVQNRGGLSAREHLTVGSQQPAWAHKNILLTSNTMPTTKSAREIPLAMIWFCSVLFHLLVLIYSKFWHPESSRSATKL